MGRPAGNLDTRLVLIRGLALQSGNRYPAAPTHSCQSTIPLRYGVVVGRTEKILRLTRKLGYIAALVSNIEKDLRQSRSKIRLRVLQTLASRSERTRVYAVHPNSATLSHVRGCATR